MPCRGPRFLMARRSPHGERGLKWLFINHSSIGTGSLPAWGAWIEISSGGGSAAVASSLPAWGAWIEIQDRGYGLKKLASLPAWGAWIEISSVKPSSFRRMVAPRMGSVD